jgi:HEAT repeat protein
MLGEPDARVRANAVEGLWESKSSFAGAVFKEATLDPDHRVAANALVGLHYCGIADEGVTEKLQSMTHSNDPLARAAVAFVMGQIVDVNSAPLLEGLLRDDHQLVRGEALRALLRIRRCNRPQEISAQTAPDSGAGAHEPPALPAPLPAGPNS